MKTFEYHESFGGEETSSPFVFFFFFFYRHSCLDPSIAFGTVDAEPAFFAGADRPFAAASHRARGDGRNAPHARRLVAEDGQTSEKDEGNVRF